MRPSARAIIDQAEENSGRDGGPLKILQSLFSVTPNALSHVFGANFEPTTLAAQARNFANRSAHSAHEVSYQSNESIPEEGQGIDSLAKKYDFENPGVWTRCDSERGILATEREDEIAKFEAIQQQIYCRICYEFIPDTGEMIWSLTCGHKFCQSCIYQYIEERILSNERLNDLRCPEPGCDLLIPESSLQTFLAEDLFERYKLFLRNWEVNCNENLLWCSNPMCDQILTLSVDEGTGRSEIEKGGSMMDQGGEVEKTSKYSTCKNEFLTIPIECEKCGSSTCRKCGEPFHENRKCDQAIDSEMRKYIKKNDIQPCPRCRHQTEKNDGCDIIMCKQCHLEWCWKCGDYYDDTHWDPYNRQGCSKTRYSCATIMCIRALTILVLPVILVFGPSFVVTRELAKRTSNGTNRCRRNLTISSVGVVSFALTPLFYAVAILFVALRFVIKLFHLEDKLQFLRQ